MRPGDIVLIDVLRPPLGATLPGPPRARRFWDHLARSRDAEPNLALSIRSDQPFERERPRAAAAERLVEEDAEGATWWLHMPGAGRKNTQVVWDPERSTLSVGAWSSSVSQQRRRSSSPGRLLWYSSTWLPRADGARATASIVGGWVGVRLPHAKPA